MGEPALPEISGMVSDESCCSRMGMPTCTTDEGAASNGIILFRTPTCRTHPRVRLHFLTVSKCLLCERRLEARVGSSRHGNDGCKHSKYFTLHLFRLREVQCPRECPTINKIIESPPFSVRACATNRLGPRRAHRHDATTMRCCEIGVVLIRAHLIW